MEVEAPIDDSIFRPIYFHEPSGYWLEFGTEECRTAEAFASEAETARAGKR